MTDQIYKNMFLIAAAWNLGGGILFAIANRWIFELSDLEPPDPLNFYFSWIAFFMAFGVGFYIVYRDMYKNLGIVLIGAIEKFAFGGIFIYYMIRHWDQVPSFFLVGVIGDLIFAVLFVTFINHARRRPG